jgi:hypothetical protein
MDINVLILLIALGAGLLVLLNIGILVLQIIWRPNHEAQHLAWPREAPVNHTVGKTPKSSAALEASRLGASDRRGGRSSASRKGRPPIRDTAANVADRTSVL